MMGWIAIGFAIGAKSKDVPGTESAITCFGFAMLAYGWLTYFHVRRRQEKRRRQASEGHGE
jgi:cytochrome oxidase assembly protein ShyY1